MKKFVGLPLIFIVLAFALWKFGGDFSQFARQTLPASWTAQHPEVRTVSLRTYGVDQLIRQSLFGSLPRRILFLCLTGLYAVVGLMVLRKLLEGSWLQAEPAWKWSDLLWAAAAVVIFWESLPEQGAVQTGALFLADGAVFLWICALAWANGYGPRQMGMVSGGIIREMGLGILSALLLLPALGVLVLAATLSAGPTFIPEQLTLAAPTSRASACLSVFILPFFEEVLFRGFVYRLLRARWPELLSNLSTSFLFAAIHGDGGLLAAGRFAGSFLMCRLFERTGTVWSSLGAHAAFNAMILLAPGIL